MTLMHDAIAVLTQDGDVTADLVVDRLREDGQPVVRLDTSVFPRAASIATRCGAGGVESVLDLGDVALDLATLRSIWCRRPADFEFADELAADNRPFARSEARQGLSGALMASPARWINLPEAEAVAGFKLVQLRHAQALGLVIPETIVTNDPEAARRFLDDDAGAGAESIYKRLSAGDVFTEDGRVTSFETEKVDAAARARLDHVAVTPCLFQRYVEKAYELRVTVVGDAVIAARVDSQASKRGATDWRVDHTLAWEAYDLPDEVATRLLAYVRRLGLVFGAIDLIRDPDGRYVFLEINPSGQWAWFPESITHRIRDAIVAELRYGPTVDRRAPVSHR